MCLIIMIRCCTHILKINSGRLLPKLKIPCKGQGKSKERIFLKEKFSNDNAKGNVPTLREPDLLMIITGTEFAYRRDDGVFVIPLGCLREYATNGHIFNIN